MVGLVKMHVARHLDHIFQKALEVLRELVCRERNDLARDIPILFMNQENLLVLFGFGRFDRDAEQAGLVFYLELSVHVLGDEGGGHRSHLLQQVQPHGGGDGAHVVGRRRVHRPNGVVLELGLLDNAFLCVFLKKGK